MATSLPRPALKPAFSMGPAVYDDVSPKLYPVAARSLSAHLDKLAAERRALELGGRWQLQG